MDNEPAITLHCILKNGKREKAKLTHYTLPEEEEAAMRMLQMRNGLYREIEICSDYGMVETIQNPAVPASSWDDLRITGNHLAHRANR